MISQSASALCGAAAQSFAFTATAPLIPGSGLAIVRAALAIVLVPMLWQVALGRSSADPLASIVTGAVEGVALGMSASIVAGAVKAAGDAIDAALDSPPFASHASGAGPIDRLYQTAYAAILFGSGGFAAMVAGLVRANAGLPRHLFVLHGLVTLANVSLRESLLLAGPCLFAQALATIVSGLIARVSPALGGVLFGASVSPAFVMLALAAGASTLVPELLTLVRDTIALSSNLVR